MSTLQRFLSLARWLVVCLVFFALPILIFVRGVGNGLSVLEQRAKDEAFHEMDFLLKRISRMRETEPYLD